MFTRDFYLTSKLLEISFSVLSIFLVYFLTLKLFKDKKLSIFASFFWAINPWHLLWSVPGMETSLFTFVSLLGIYFSIENDYKKNIFAMFFFGVSTLIRPEGAFLFLIVMSIKFILFLKKKYEIKNLLLMGACFIAVVSPWLIYSYVTFGSITPNSFNSIRSFLKFSIQGSFGAGFSGLLLLVGSFMFEIPFFIISLYKITVEKSNLCIHLIPIVWLVSLLGFYLLTGIVFVRYFIPVFPFIIIYSLYGLEMVSKSFGKSGRYLFYVFVVLFLLSDSVLASFAYSFSVRHVNELMSSYFEISYWFKNNTPKNSTIAAHDFGVLGFISERRIIDITGLVDKEAFPYRENLAEFLEIKKPNYLFIVDEWYYSQLSPFIQKCERIQSKTCSDCLFPYGNFTFSVYRC